MYFYFPPNGIKGFLFFFFLNNGLLINFWNKVLEAFSSKKCNGTKSGFSISSPLFFHRYGNTKTHLIRRDFVKMRQDISKPSVSLWIRFNPKRGWDWKKVWKKLPFKIAISKSNRNSFPIALFPWQIKTDTSCM